MTPAQTAIQRCAGSWIDKVREPFGAADLVKLLEILKDCESDSIWGLAIYNVFTKGGDQAKLIINLASQAVDDPLTMADIIGVKGTTLLLRYYDTKNSQ